MELKMNFIMSIGVTLKTSALLIIFAAQAEALDALDKSSPTQYKKKPQEYVNHKLEAQAKAHGMQLRELIFRYYRQALSKGILTEENFKVGDSFEIEGITFNRRFWYGKDTISIGVSIPYFVSEESKSPTQKDSAKFSFASTLNSLMQIMNAKRGRYDLDEKQANNFLEAANYIPLTDPRMCEKSFVGVGSRDAYASCRKIALSRFLGLGEPQYKIECLVSIPIAQLEEINKQIKLNRQS